MGLASQNSARNGYNAAFKKLTGHTVAGSAATKETEAEATESLTTPKNPKRVNKSEELIKPASTAKAEAELDDEEASFKTQVDVAASENGELDTPTKKTIPAPKKTAAKGTKDGTAATPAKKGARKAGDVDGLEGATKTPAAKRAKKEPELDANGNPVKAKRTRKPKTDENGNPVPPKPRGRKPKEAVLKNTAAAGDVAADDGADERIISTGKTGSRPAEDVGVGHVFTEHLPVPDRTGSISLEPSSMSKLAVKTANDLATTLAEEKARAATEEEKVLIPSVEENPVKPDQTEAERFTTPAPKLTSNPMTPSKVQMGRCVNGNQSKTSPSVKRSMTPAIPAIQKEDTPADNLRLAQEAYARAAAVKLAAEKAKVMAEKEQEEAEAALRLLEENSHREPSYGVQLGEEIED